MHFGGKPSFYESRNARSCLNTPIHETENLALALTAVCAAPVWADNAVSLIPLPQTVKMEQGTFEFSKKLKTAVDAYPGDSIQWVLDNFEKNFTATTGVKFQTGKWERPLCS